MKKILLATFTLLLVIVLTACGGSENANNNDSGDTIDNTLDVQATEFTFDQEEYVVKSGQEVTVNLESTEGIHGFAIDEFGVDIQDSGTATFTPEEPGEYEIYCSVPCGEGHEDMKATLIVQ